MKDQLEALVAQMHSSGILYSEAVREFKKRFIMNVLQQNKGNQCYTARELGMHRNSLSRSVGELKIDVREFRSDGRYTARKPPASTIEYCNCTGRQKAHVLYGPNCARERAQANGA